MMTVLPLLILMLFAAVSVACGAKYVTARITGSDVQHKSVRLFAFVAFCEAVAFSIASLVPAAVIQSLDLRPVGVQYQWLWWVAIALTYSILAVVPNALLLRNQQAQTVRAVLATRRNILHSWLLSAFLLAVWLLIIAILG